jgi:hypothetical protein
MIATQRAHRCDRKDMIRLLNDSAYGEAAGHQG